MKKVRLVDDPDVVSKVRAMRESGATYAQISAELGMSPTTISKILGVRGAPRPRISADVRARARELRKEDHSVPEIAREFGIAKSTAWEITKDMTWQPSPDRVARAKRAARMRWDRENARRDDVREQMVREAAARVGQLSDRELLLIGVVLYWAEGGKTKPWSRREWLHFVNSDPDVIQLYMAWLRLMGVTDDRLTFRVQIHESADVPAAEKYWADIVDVPIERFARTTLKRHNPKTVRKNTGDGYRGCLIVRVRGSSTEYRTMDGLWRGICEAIQKRAVISAERVG